MHATLRLSIVTFLSPVSSSCEEATDYVKKATVGERKTTVGVKKVAVGVKKQFNLDYPS